MVVGCVYCVLVLDVNSVVHWYIILLFVFIYFTSLLGVVMLFDSVGATGFGPLWGCFRIILARAW